MSETSRLKPPRKLIAQWRSPEERRQLGQASRKQLARQHHSQLPRRKRTIPAIDLLERSMRGRIRSLVTLKYRLMLQSPFGYFRGAVHVMASDLAELPITGLEAQLCGDAHVRNLGAYAAPDGRLVFDINDFDETIRGPFEWDLKRMAASLVLAGREAGQKDSVCSGAVENFAKHYALIMRTLAEMPTVDMARYQVHRLQHIEPVARVLLKAERATPQHTLGQLTVPTGKKPTSPRRFKVDKPILTPVPDDEADSVLKALAAYTETLLPERRLFLTRYRPVDVAFKVVGTGSVGLRDYCVYMEGNGPADPLFMQIKEEQDSAYTPYLPNARPQRHNGRRVAEGQRAMQMQSDPFLGWTEIDKRHYLVRQLNDHKSSIDLEDLSGDGLSAYAELCGELLARGHARSSDPWQITGYLGNGGTFTEALARFGSSYADQTERDWEALKRTPQGKKAAASED